MIISLNKNTSPTIGGEAITITGNNFTGVTSVTFDGIPATNLNVVSDTQITLTTPAHNAGNAPILVIISPIQTSAPFNNFTYGNIPEITSLSPNYTTSPNGGSVITITGNYLNDVTTVIVGSQSAAPTSHPDNQHLTFIAPANAQGDYSVTAQSVYGSSNSNNMLAYRPAPAISNIVNDTAGLGYPAGPMANSTQTLHINGTGFYNVTQVTFGGTTYTAGQFNVQSPTLIIVPIPLVATGPLIVTSNVQVTSIYGVSGLTPYYYYPVPTIDAFNPASMPSGGALQVVTFEGLGIGGLNGDYTTISMGSQNCEVTNSSIQDNAFCNLFSPPSPAVVNINILTPGGSVVAANAFAFTP